ncbi:MAG: RNA-binding protein [Phycisphaeraceae bacterium]|nr:RNA-binding protein [Phycisphaeraceae bacterium]
MFKVFVGNLDQRTTADSLRPIFEPFGDLDEIIVAIDPKTKRSRGFAIVLFRDPLKGQLAIETLTGRKINGRTIIINEALKKGKAPQRGPGQMARQGPFGPRLGTARGGVGGRRFSNRNPRRGSSAGGPGGSRPGGPVPGSSPGAAPPARSSESPPAGGPPRPQGPPPTGASDPSRRPPSP